MRSFVDSMGRTWAVGVNVATLKKVKGFLGLDLYQLLEKEPEKFGEILGDPITLVDVLFVLCQDQAATLGVSDEAFGRGMFGDVIEAASLVLVEEMIDFFHNPRVRAGLKKMIQTSELVKAKMLDQMEANIENLTVEKLIAAGFQRKQNA